MKRIIKIFILAIFILTGCSLVDIDIPNNVPVSEKNSKLILKSGSGFNSVYGNIYVPNKTVVSLIIEGKGAEIKSVLWSIEGSNYEGLQITHKFNFLGETKVKVEVLFVDGKKESRDFTIVSVLDISTADPIQIFTEKNSSGDWEVLFLFSKERLRYATSTSYMYDGLVVDWKKKSIPENNSYVINSDGKPEMTNDVGKYVGIKINLSYRGLYNITLVHSGDNWIDLSGSKYTRSDNPGLAWFWFENGMIIPQGNAVANNLPGVSGDTYFRFTVNEDSKKMNLFFKLEKTFTSAAFVLKQNDNGSYASPIIMSPVPNYEQWGQIELSTENQLQKILGFRYGPNKDKPTEFSINMDKSYFYDIYHKNIRFIIYKI